jgi:adenine-specific DNA-methyltransferase
MQNLMKDISQLFQKDERIFADGKLLKNKLTELALKLDHQLIELLLSDNKAKEHFFIEKTVKKTAILVFDKDKFITFVNNKEFLPDSFTGFKNKIGLVTNGDYLKEKGDVVLAWPYKDCVLEGGQDNEDQSRDEIFYNEALSPDEIDRLFEPKVLTNFKRYNSKGEHKIAEFKADDNVIIKGNNLLALHCLKQKFRGQVKLIYIDPPYNTGNDSFHYNDKFNHSTWLTFMKNRLQVASELLSIEGAIFISIDDNEMPYLKVLCDEIFGRENFRNCIVWKKLTSAKAQSKFLGNVVEHILFYSKTDSVVFYEKYLESGKDDKNYPYEEEGTGRRYGSFDFTQAGQGEAKKFGDKVLEPPKGKHWIWGQEKINEGLKQGVIIFTKNGTPRLKRYLDEKQGNYLSDLWNDEEVSPMSANDKERLSFNGQKKEALLKRIMEITTKENDLVIDFHLGTGTTCAVANKMKRRYIGIEQIDSQIKIILKRLVEVIKGDKTGISQAVNYQGGGSFVYAELMEWSEQYIQEIKDADSSRKLLNIYGKMKKEAFFRYDVDLSKLKEKEFEKLPLKEQKQVLCECLDKNHLYVNLSEIDDATYKVSEDDKKLNKEFYKTVV